MTVSVRVNTTSLVFTFAILFGNVSEGADEPRIGVLTLHGVGSQRQGSDFDARLRASLQEKAGDKTKIVVKSVYYAPEARNRQAELWKEFDRLEDRSPDSLDQKIIRRLMLATVGDALAYANNPNDTNSYYFRAHNEVRIAIDHLEAEIGNSSLVVVVAHSLGCKIVFDYLCDVQTGQGIWAGETHPSEFQKLANLRLLITTGCNLPFFESAVPDTEQRFFRPNEQFQWVNFYDRDDLLGWPLRPLGGRFAEIVDDEERNHIGSPLTSHIRYWTDKELNDEIAERVFALTGTNKATNSGE